MWKSFVVALLFVTPALAQEQATAYEALRVVGTQFGRGGLNHLVSITGCARMNGVSPSGLSRSQINRPARSARSISVRVAARSGARKECLPVRPWRMWKQQGKIATTEAESLAAPRHESSMPSIGPRKKRG